LIVADLAAFHVPPPLAVIEARSAETWNRLGP
jgi:hypothetical protein